MERREFILSNRRGQRLLATLRLPETVVGTAIVCHGLAGWKDQRIIATMADATADAGYATVTFNEANGPNGPDTRRKKSTTTGYLEDLEDVIAHIRTEAWFTGPLVLAGHSLGGLICAEYAARTQNTIDRLILVAPALTWRAYPKFIYLLAAWWLITDRHRMQGPNRGGFILGRNWLTDFRRFNAYHSAERLSMPVLLIMGEKDGLVGTALTHARYARALPQCTWHLMKDTDHDFIPQMRELAGTIRQWLTSS